MMVFIQEDGRGKVASQEMSSFLREAGFPVIDPALAIEEESQALVAAAMAGNDGAATQLGQNWGAQVLVLGVADYGTAPDPVRQTLTTATTEVMVRALRLDVGEVVSDAVASARDIDATPQAARAKAIRQATRDAIEASSARSSTTGRRARGKRRTTGSPIRGTSGSVWRAAQVRRDAHRRGTEGARDPERGRPPRGRRHRDEGHRRRAPQPERAFRRPERGPARGCRGR